MKWTNVYDSVRKEELLRIKASFKKLGRRYRRKHSFALHHDTKFKSPALHVDIYWANQSEQGTYICGPVHQTEQLTKKGGKN